MNPLPVIQLFYNYQRYTGPIDHPVAHCHFFFQAVHTHKLNKIWLTRLLDAREKDLGSSVFYTTNEIESYAENTYSSLLYLTLQSLGRYIILFIHPCIYLSSAHPSTINSVFISGKITDCIPFNLILHSFYISTEEITQSSSCTHHPIYPSIFYIINLLLKAVFVTSFIRYRRCKHRSCCESYRKS